MNAKVAEAITHGPSLLLRFAIAGVLGILSYALLIAVASSTEYTYLRLAPSDHWFEYESVAVVSPVRSGQPLMFASTAAIHRRLDIRWSDTLFCDIGDGEFFYRNHPSQRDDVPPRSKKTVFWRFPNFAMPAGATCRGEHVITAQLKYGITKRSVTRSGPFTVE